MRRIIIFGVLVLLSVHSVFAETTSTLNPLDLMRQAIAYGVDDAMKYQGETLYNISSPNSTSTSTLPEVLTSSNRPILENDFSSKSKDMMAFLYKWLLGLYIVSGALIVIISDLKPNIGQRVQKIRFIDNNVLDLERFLMLSVLGIVIWKLGDRGIEIIFDFEWALTKMFTKQIIYIPPPVLISGIDYLFNGTATYFLTGFGIYRAEIDGIAVGARYLLMILCFFPKVGSVAYGFLIYALVLLFSRVALIIATWGAVAVAQSTDWSASLSFVVLYGILTFGCIVIMLSPILFRGLFTRVYRVVISV